MSFPNFFLILKKVNDFFGLREDFDFFKDLFIKKKFPKVILLSGDKGIGKFTLISHLMFLFLIKIIIISQKIRLIKKIRFLINF